MLHFCRLLGGSWGAPGALLAAPWRLLGRSWPLPGRSWGALWPPGGLLLELFGPLSADPLENSENLENHCVFNGFGRFLASPGDPKSCPNSSEIALARVLSSFGAHLARSWRLLAASWRFWGLLGVSWAALEAILAQKGNPPDPRSGVGADRLPPPDPPFRG